jgi:cation diffusion facilitator family transporter
MKIDERQRLGYLEGWISVALNTTLFVFKYWVGSRLGSISMVADAWHTLSDTLTSVVVILGFWIMAKPPDEKHPFGHARAENIAAIVIGVLLAVVSASFFRDSVNRLATRKAATFSILGIAVFAVSVLAKEGLAQFAFRAGRKINSQSVIADGWHHRSDAIASALIVAGAVLGGAFWWIDGVLGIGVSLLILYAAFDIFRGTSSILLGESPDPKVRADIEGAVRAACPEAHDVHHIHMHRYGSAAEVTVHIRLRPDMSVQQSHDISLSVERRIRENLGMEATVHVEPMGYIRKRSGS